MKEELKIATKVSVRPSELHRYGLLATDNIEKGEGIEETMFIRTTQRAKDENRDPALYHYSYGINCSCDKCKKEGINFAIPFGYCQYTNHSVEPNAGLVHDYQEGLTSLVSLRPIEKDEEILMNYGAGFQEWLDKMHEIQSQMKLENSQQTEKFEEGPIKFRAREIPTQEPTPRGIKEMVDQANELNDEE